MKTHFFAARAALLGLIAVFLLFACKPKPKTLDTVLKDIPAETYSLSFEGLPSNPIITKSSYGSAPADFTLDIDEICPPLRKFGYKKIPPILVWPTVVPPRAILVPPPTCPEFVPFKIRDFVLEAINKSGWQYAKDLTTVKAGDHAVIIAKDQLAAYQSIQADSMDMIGMKGVNLDEVFVVMPALSAPAGQTEGGGPCGFFCRYWYGQRLKDLVLPPRQIGCRDPRELTILRDNLVRYNEKQFGGLKVAELQPGKGATLSF